MFGIFSRAGWRRNSYKVNSTTQVPTFGRLVLLRWSLPKAGRLGLANLHIQFFCKRKQFLYQAKVKLAFRLSLIYPPVSLMLFDVFQCTRCTAYSRSSRWATQVFTRVQGDRGIMPRKRSFETVCDILNGKPLSLTLPMTAPPLRTFFNLYFSKVQRKNLIWWGLFLVSNHVFVRCYHPEIHSHIEGLPPLTQRQERRSRPSAIVTHGTIDSWDFSLTASPTTSLPIRPGHLRKTSYTSPRQSTDSSSSVVAEGVFEFESEIGVIAASPSDGVDIIKKNDEQQLELLTPCSPDISPSPSSSSMTSPSGAATSAETSVPDALPSLPTSTTMSTVIGSTPLPVPVPAHSDTHADVETHLRPSSTPSPSVPPHKPSSLPLPTSALQPSTSAPPNLAQPSSSSSLWRKLTGSTPKAEDEVKVKRGFLSRKASNALVKTKSRTASKCLFTLSMMLCLISAINLKASCKVIQRVAGVKPYLHRIFPLSSLSLCIAIRLSTLYYYQPTPRAQFPICTIRPHV